MKLGFPYCRCSETHLSYDVYGEAAPQLALEWRMGFEPMDSSVIASKPQPGACSLSSRLNHSRNAHSKLEI